MSRTKFLGCSQEKFPVSKQTLIVFNNFFITQVCFKGTEKNVRDVQGLQKEEVGTPTGRCIPHNHYKVCLLY